MGGGRGRPGRTAAIRQSWRRRAWRAFLWPGRPRSWRVRIALLEALDAAGRVDELGFTREERVAVRADLEAELGLRALGLPRVPARAMHGHVVVLLSLIH